MTPLRKKILKQARIEQRRSVATQCLNGMLASAPMCDRTKINVRVWVAKAYEFADELIRQAIKRA